jgi:hypothetical protein
LNVFCGSSVNHPVTPKFWSRTNNIAAIHWCIATLQPIMVSHRNLTFARPYFVINTHPTNNFKWPNPLRSQFPSFRSAYRYTVSPGANGRMSELFLRSISISFYFLSLNSALLPPSTS